jgi:nicotinamidase-related amidase
MKIKLLKTFIFMATLINQTAAQPTTKRQALLIVDIQNDFTGNNAKMPVDKTQAEQMINNLNQLTKRINTSETDIIYIGNEYSKWDFLNLFRNFAAVKGTPGIDQDSRLNVVSDKYFPKNRTDAFSNPELKAYLQSMNVHELFIAGLKAEACILGTVKGGLRNHYKVNVLTDCIATNSDRKREKIVKIYERLGAKNMSSSAAFHETLLEGNMVDYK